MDETLNEEEQISATRVDELALVREVVLQAHPNVVPELIGGTTIAELLASVEPAKAAFERLSERVKPATSTPPAVPAGSTTAIVDPATLPAHELIKRGIGSRRRND
jgi:hypothetical protein